LKLCLSEVVDATITDQRKTHWNNCTAVSVSSNQLYRQHRGN